ncbi:hypothetical protein GCM10020255_032140 [Rhodococcus baikonurensis]
MGEPDQCNHPLDAPVALPNRDVLTELAPREFEVLEHLVAGRRNKAISERLGVSESTIKFHVAGVLRKLGVESRGAAAAAGAEAVKPAPSPFGQVGQSVRPGLRAPASG